MDELENLVTVIDDDGTEHIFEELDRIETEYGQKYIALLPFIEDEEIDEEDNSELIILKVSEDSGDTGDKEDEEDKKEDVKND